MQMHVSERERTDACMDVPARAPVEGPVTARLSVCAVPEFCTATFVCGPLGVIVYSRMHVQQAFILLCLLCQYFDMHL